MSNSPTEVKGRIAAYAARYDCVTEDQLGFGYDGLVISTNRQSAIKGFRYQPLHDRERDVYLRLAELEIFKVRGFNVPRLLRFDDELQCIEMTIVRPPFVLDFAGAYLDFSPEYATDVLAAWREEKAEQFGDNWPEVQRVMREFAAMGIFLADVKPGNIEFAN